MHEALARVTKCVDFKNLGPIAIGVELGEILLEKCRIP